MQRKSRLKDTILGSANVDLVIRTVPLEKGTTNSMAQYDGILKHLMHQYANEFAMLSFGTPEVQVFRVIYSKI